MYVCSSVITSKMIIISAHPGHTVHASHPSYPVSVIQSLLQGRVYHRVGIFLWELADSPIGCKRAIICSNYSFSSLLWPLFVLPNAWTLELLFISKCCPPPISGNKSCPRVTQVGILVVSPQWERAAPWFDSWNPLIEKEWMANNNNITMESQQQPT